MCCHYCLCKVPIGNINAIQSAIVPVKCFVVVDAVLLVELGVDLILIPGKHVGLQGVARLLIGQGH